MSNRAEMMMARDAASRAMNSMKAADAAWEANPSEEANMRQAKARKEWKKAVKKVEAVQRAMWAAEDAKAA